MILCNQDSKTLYSSTSECNFSTALPNLKPQIIIYIIINYSWGEFLDHFCFFAFLVASLFVVCMLTNECANSNSGITTQSPLKNTR